MIRILMPAHPVPRLFFSSLCYCLQVIVSAALISGLVGLVSSYNRNRDFEEESLKAQLNYLYHYMQHRKLPRRLQQRISNYYLLIWSHARVSQVRPSMLQCARRWNRLSWDTPVHASAILNILVFCLAGGHATSRTPLLHPA